LSTRSVSKHASAKTVGASTLAARPCGKKNLVCTLQEQIDST
jgi:hypothetical protein